MSAVLNFGDGIDEQAYLDYSEDQTVSLTFDDQARCRVCGETVVEDFTSWTHEATNVSACYPDDPDSEDELELAQSPDLFANSASISTSENEVTVAISVGDPRGAFTMTVRRMESGQLILHTPYPDMSFAHMPIEQVSPGTFRIG